MNGEKKTGLATEYAFYLSNHKATRAHVSQCLHVVEDKERVDRSRKEITKIGM